MQQQAQQNAGAVLDRRPGPSSVRAHFYCRQCGITNTAPKCIGCYQFLVDSVREIDPMLPDPPIPPSGRIGCAVCVSHWGDVFYALSATRQTLDALEQDSCEFLYCGPDATIPEFLESQTWIRRVYFVPPGADYSAGVRNAISTLKPVSEWYGLLTHDATADYPPESDIWPTCVANYWHSMQFRVKPLPSPSLPVPRVKWAKDFLRSLGLPKGQKPVLLHPSSTWSAGAGDHWPYWHEAVEWLIAETPHTYLLTGLNAWNGPKAAPDRLIDATGKLPSNMENLALVRLCGRAVTTCNSAALWSVMNGVPAVIVGNRAITTTSNPFWRFMDRDPAVYVKVDDDLSAFQSAARRILG